MTDQPNSQPTKDFSFIEYGDLQESIDIKERDERVPIFQSKEDALRLLRAGDYEAVSWMEGQKVMLATIEGGMVVIDE